MCKRFDLTASLEELNKEFGGIPLHEVSPRYNVAPSQNVLVIRYEAGLGKVWRLLRWGLVPHWAQDETIGSKMIHVRAEIVDKEPPFQESFQGYRCLIPATGFFGWPPHDKQPYRITRKDGVPFAFGGIHTFWLAPNGYGVESCAIITTTSNKTMEPISGRMPVILAAEDYDYWIDPGNSDYGQLKSMLMPCPFDWLKTYPVGKFVNNPKNDSPKCIKPQ